MYIVYIILLYIKHKIVCYVRIPYLEDIGFLGKDPRDVALINLDESMMMSVEMPELPLQTVGEG